MAPLRRLLLRLWNAARPGAAEPELARELAAHLALLEDDFRRRGLGEQDARLAARRALGGVLAAQDRHRDARSFVWLDDLRRDLAYALRTLRRAPGFGAAVVLTLALGIGANTAVFSVLDGVMLKPLRYPDPDRIVAVLLSWTDRGRTQPNLPGGDELDIAATRGTFDAIAYYYGGEIGVQLGDHAEYVGTQIVHPDFFRVFGLAPVAGRLLERDDAQRSAIVSAGFAQRNFGSAGAALGRPLFVESRSYPIVGVMPPAMQFPAGTQVWVAAPLAPENRNRSGNNFRVVARLARGVSLEAANAALARLGTQLARSFPDTNARKTFVATTLRETLAGRSRATLLVLMAAVSLVLLTACANVANLMLARTAGRARDVAVRAALGAGRRHLVRQLLAESLLLALAAAALGVLLAAAGTGALLRAGARFVPLPRLEDVHVDWRVLLFTAAVSVLTAVAFGLLPALQATRVDVKSALNRGGGRGALGGSCSRTRGALVVVQVALSFVLAIAAGLLLRSFVSLTEAPLGFRAEGVLVAYAHAPARGSLYDRSGIDSYLRAGRFFDDLFTRLRRLPGVVAASGVMGLPTGQYDSNGSYAVEGIDSFSGDLRRLPSAGFRLAAPGYFATMGIPLRRGRDFDGGDLYDRPFVAVISESLARQSFGRGDPIGRRVMCGFDQPDKWMTIVGVVGDVRQASPAARPGPELYMPLRQHPYAANEVQVIVRSRVPPESLIAAVGDVVRSMNLDVALKFTTMDASIGESIAAPRFRMVLVSTFASLALLLAIAGMYAVMSYLTAQRSAEFGLRVALGAQQRDVVAIVLAGATRLLAIGAALGLLLALAAGRVIEAMLFGVGALDVTTYVAVLLTAIPLVGLAALLPALRAARVAPVAALREL